MKALKLIYGQSFEPDVLEMLGDVFDEIWAEIAVQSDPYNDQEMRLQLARIMLLEYQVGMEAAPLRSLVIRKIQPTLVATMTVSEKRKQDRETRVGQIRADNAAPSA